MSPEQLLRLQEKKLNTQHQELKNLGSAFDRLAAKLAATDATIKAQSKLLENLKLGRDFREFIRMAAEYVLPFRYIVELPISASTQRIVQPFQTSPEGWFFADRVWASWRPTAGPNANTWRALAHSNPPIAVSDAAGNIVPDVLDFTWEYSEARTNRARQNESRTIPGDLLFRNDGDGFLLNGDPWSPATAVTIAATPLVAPDNPGVLTFTFLGEQCVNTPEVLLSQWVGRKREAGIV
jgi:hypothetical protein